MVKVDDMIKKLAMEVRSLRQENKVLRWANDEFMEDVGQVRMNMLSHEPLPRLTRQKRKEDRCTRSYENSWINIWKWPRRWAHHPSWINCSLAPTYHSTWKSWRHRSCPSSRSLRWRCTMGLLTPLKRLETFKAQMTLYGFPSEIACRAFPLTMKDTARGWFRLLPPGPINRFEELSHLFLTQFMANKKRKRSMLYLLILKTRRQEYEDIRIQVQ